MKFKSSRQTSNETLRKNELFRIQIPLLQILFLLISSKGILPAPPPAATPKAVTGVVEGEVATRLFLNFNRSFRIMNELRGRLEGENSQLHNFHFMTGPYYRIQKNITLGAFYKIQRGFRNLNDWQSTSNGWQWKDARARNDHLLVGDITFRFLVPFIPSENLVLEFKNRYDRNFSTNLDLATIRPGLTWFWMQGARPIMNFFLQYEIWWPIGWGDSRPWETWAYIGALYHFSPELKMGTYLAFRKTRWTPSSHFIEKFPGENYSRNELHRSIVLGLSILYNLNQ